MMKKRKKLKRIVSFILTVCITFSATFGTGMTASAGTSAAPAVKKPPSVWVSGGKSFVVNKVYSTGLTVCGTALVKIAGSTDCEEFQKVASFINKWICGGGQGQTLGEIKALCTQILNEVKVVEKELTVYTAQIEKMLGEDRYNDLLRELDKQWDSDVASIESKNNIKSTLDGYRNYMNTAESYTNGQCSMYDVDKAEKALFNEFCNIYKIKNGNIKIENNTYEKLREIIFSDTSIYDCIYEAINTMRNNLLKDTNYADVSAQFAYQALPFATDQHDYVLACINKQYTEIIMLEMMCQEYLAQFGDYLEDEYPDDKGKWNGYDMIVDDFRLLNEKVAETMESMLDRKLQVYPLYGIEIKISEYPSLEDAAKVTLYNKNYKKEWTHSLDDFSPHNGYETNITTKAVYTKENQSFERVFTLTNNGIKPFFIAMGSEEEMRIINLDYKKDIYGEADQHAVSADFMNLTKGVYGDGVNNNYKCPVDDGNELKDLFNTNAYLMCDSVPVTYLSQYYSYANGKPVYLLTGKYKLSTRNRVTTGYESFYTVEASETNIIDNFKTIELKGGDIQKGKSKYNSYYSLILTNNDDSFKQKTDVKVDGTGSAEIFINNEKKTDNVTVPAGSEINLRFKANSEDTVLKSLTVQRHNDASNTSKVTNETEILTREQISDLDKDGNGYYIFSYNAPYSNITISLNVEKGHYVYCGRDRSSSTILLDSYTNIYLKDETVNFFVDDNVENVVLDYGNTSTQIRLNENEDSGRTGSFVMPDSDVVLNVSLTPCSHNYTDNGFCSKCGAYQKAEFKNNMYEISNGGQLFWFASMVNGDNALAEFDKQDSDAKCIITADIDLEGREWKPINNFKGTFDGQNHTVSALKITKTSSKAGLFGSVSAGTIKNLVVKGDITLESSGSDNGGIAGYADGATISNVSSYVNIKNTDKEQKHVGGIIGTITNNKTVVEKCVYYGQINLANSVDCIGGVAAYTNGGGRISNCVNLGTVTASKEDAFIGGILGYLNNSAPTVKNCYNYGKVSNGGKNTKCGAVIGWVRKSGSGNISDNYYLDSSASLAFGSDSKSGLAAVPKNDGQFASGEVAFLLNNGVTTGKQVWYQTIGEDKVPVLDNTHKTVYKVNSKLCPGCKPEAAYSNINGDSCGEHNFVNGVCTYCGLEIVYPFDKDDDDNFIIRTYDDLVKLSEIVRSDYDIYGDKGYVLENNIIAPNDSVWKTGIGSISENKPFNGTFNGNGYCIIGLNIDSSKYGGIFEIIGEKGNVSNLFVTNYKYVSACENAGSIAAVNNGTIDHCTNGINVGSAFVFKNPETKEPIKASELNSEIKGTLSGGIAARNAGLIRGCRNAAVITGTECGGIAGINTGKIYGCANNGTVGNINSSSTKTAGGIAGKNGGIIESSYNSEKVYGKSCSTVGSIAGLNGFDTETNPKVNNVFYITINGLNAAGTDSLVKSVGSSNVVKKQSEMRQDTFTEELNKVTDDTVKWCRGETINKGYPRIENNFFEHTVKTLENGITLKGSMHSSLNISYKLLEENSDEYNTLVSDINKAGNDNENIDTVPLKNYGSSSITINDEKKVLKGYSVSLTDKDKNPILAELWIQGDIEISVPAEHENVSLMGVGSDGQVVECEPESFENGAAVFKMSEPISFILVDKSDRTDSDTPVDEEPDNKKDTVVHKDNNAVKTGDLTNLILLLLLVSVSSATVIILWRRRKVE